MLGISGSNSSAVLSVTAAVNSIGRILAGRLADKAGVMNVLIAFNFLSGVMVLAIWLVAKDLGVMMGFAILWGLFSGGAFFRGLLLCAVGLMASSSLLGTRSARVCTNCWDGAARLCGRVPIPHERHPAYLCLTYRRKGVYVALDPIDVTLIPRLAVDYICHCAAKRCA